MEDRSVMLSSVMDVIQRRLGDRVDEFRIPPPVFGAMQGEFLAFDLDGGWLTARFPVLEEYLNPYGSMQGGMVAAAVDNTLGPLSMLVAPPNVTRRLEMKYSRPITTDLEFIIVTAKLVERKGRWLTFSAKVEDQEEMLLARARAVHWIVDEKVPSQISEG
jgi:acyl-coenzyme A thioesterase PaaI-like protein